VERLRDEGKAVILITHNMDQVVDFADRAVVMRRGRKVGEIRPSADTRQEIVSMIVGA
jgi:D-xylose transport system ATP-binding protein